MRRRYQLSIRQIMLLILLGTVWVQLKTSWHRYNNDVHQERRSQLLQYYGIKIQNIHEPFYPAPKLIPESSD